MTVWGRSRSRLAVGIFLICTRKTMTSCIILLFQHRRRKFPPFAETTKSGRSWFRGFKTGSDTHLFRVRSSRVERTVFLALILARGSEPNLKDEGQNVSRSDAGASPVGFISFSNENFMRVFLFPTSSAAFKLAKHTT
jgi:hypothetical protein